MATPGRRNVRGLRWKKKSLADGGKGLAKDDHEAEDAMVLSEEGFKLASRKVNQLNDSEKELLKSSILKFWFFLEPDLKEAITKGNLQLAKMAIPRIKFLARRVDQDMLSAALKGNAQDIEDLQHFLLHQGLSEKADHLKIAGDLEPISKEKLEFERRVLLDFIWAHQDLVHENVLLGISKNDEESIDLALRHIHYGSLRRAREGNRKTFEQGSQNSNKRMDFKDTLLKPPQPKQRSVLSDSKPQGSNSEKEPSHGENDDILWKTRDKNSYSLPSSLSTIEKSVSIEESLQNNVVTSLSSVVNHVNKLQLGKKRGRPPKKGGRKNMNCFSVKKGKTKNDMRSVLPRNIDAESAKVLESCLLMGLGLEMCRVDALTHIKDRLE
ncbi:hypothetical protein ACET3Z_015507 [Daucus carota]